MTVFKIFSPKQKVMGLICVAVLLAFSPVARAVDIQEVTSPGGIKAWLVQETSIPIISMEVVWKGGSVTNGKDKAGLAHLAASTMDEGAGDLDSRAFQKRLSDSAIDLSFEAGKESFSGSLKTLSENRDEAFHLFELAITKPRFDAEPVERIRSQILVSLNRKKSDPGSIAGRRWFELAFGDHPFAVPTHGFMETVETLTIDDLKAYQQVQIAKDNMYISVVGDIDAKTLGQILDRTFGAIAKTASLTKVPEIQIADMKAPVLDVTEMDIPQSRVIFGGAGVKREDPDYYAAYVLNYILGGGGFSSRLTEEIREKRGLVYSVYSYLSPFDAIGLHMGGFGTSNKAVGEAISLVKEELTKMRQNGVTEAELKAAKTYLNGSFPLSLSSNSRIANILVSMQLSKLPPEYLEQRANLINQVTLEDIKRVAARLMDPEKLVVTVVGKPEGL